ncbi:MAG TPA: hypothetical protein VJ603_03385 [Paucimonas sp.]|nr:hypothetical protein [Paucimonas sp.]HJW54669.1 hypothetical protein [Burkholderiaceae bacterium]
MRTAQEAKKQDHSLYELLYVAEEDLAQASFYAGHLLKNSWHFVPWETRRRWKTYMQQSAYTTALVVAYSRAFVKSRGWPEFPKRLIKYSQEQNLLHKKILNLRNEVYAHSDIKLRQIKPVKINDYPSAIEYLPEMRLKKEEIEELINMISITKSTIRNRLKQLIDSVEN